jgi:acetyl-CoA carboxylase biotin carboxyl carrier protein
MDIDKIQQLIQILKEHNLAQLEVKQDAFSICIKQFPPNAPIVSSTASTHPATVSTIVDETIQMQNVAHNVHVVRSPMVGTVYLAPNPTAPLFVTVGQHVNEGDTLCIVEAMKTMNQIQSDKSGVVQSCLVENAMPVEFDQPLFVIE